MFKENLFQESEEEFKVDYQKEIAREKSALQHIDKIPLVNEERPLKLFQEISKVYPQVKWVGRSISIEEHDLMIKPPYQANSIVCPNRQVLSEIQDMMTRMFPLY